MEDSEPRSEDSGANPPTQELRINIPTAASLVGNDPVDGAQTLSNEQVTPAPATPRLVGRSLNERLAAGGLSEGGSVDAPSTAERFTGSFALPDWSEPPTGLVPRVLLDECELEGIEGDLVESGQRGPSWREGSSDWDNDADLAFLIEAEEESSDASMIAGQIVATEHPFEGGFDEINLVLGNGNGRGAGAAADLIDNEDLDAWEPEQTRLLGNGEASVDRDVSNTPLARRSPRRVHEKAPAPRNPFVATLVGAAVGGIALGCFALGAQASLVLVTLLVTAASAEVFSSLRRAGYRPATLLGLIAVPMMTVGAYLHGPIVVPFVIAMAMVGFAIWGVLGLTAEAPVMNLGVTALVICWTGILGSFAGLLLNPASFPDRTGVAFVVAAVALTVAHDVGSYAVGSFFGRHPIAPTVSPGKTVEGLIGGSLLTIGVAIGIVARIHPFDMTNAIVLGVLVLFVAPLGDLFESVVKRDLGLKDMGKILPAHGGVFDRIDAMLFVLPVCYVLIRIIGLA